jgi:hypothetical protein
MKFATLAFPLLALAAFAQEAPPPDTVLATIDGRKVTYGEVDSYFKGIGQDAHDSAFKNPKQMIEQYALFLRLIDYATTEKLDEREPYKQSIQATRMMVMAQAAIAERSRSITVTPDEQKKYYEDHIDRYTEAKLQVIYLGFVADPVAAAKENPGKTYRTESEAKAKLEEIAKQIKTKEDFTRFAHEFSEDKTTKDKDGDFGTLKKSDNAPAELKQVIFSLKKGEVSAPVGQRNGYYIFRVDDQTFQSYESVKDAIFSEIQTARAQAWLEEQRTRPIQIENKEFFAEKTPKP